MVRVDRRPRDVVHRSRRRHGDVRVAIPDDAHDGARSWAKVDPTHQTPKRSLAIVFIVWAILVVIFGSISDNPIDTFGDFLASLAGLPGLLVYAVIAAAGVAYHWKERRTVGVVGVLGSLGVLAMAYTLYTNLVPWPDFPGISS